VIQENKRDLSIFLLKEEGSSQQSISVEKEEVRLPRSVYYEEGGDD
jgi:hypothetical protein